MTAEPADAAAGRGRLRAWRVAVPPVSVSLILSAMTVGNQAHWQDSAIYLTAIKEFSVLYPPGFALYLTLCKAWTLALGFLDFTLAVHLFSSCCAALAAGFLSLAAQRVTRDDASSAIIGCLAAAGYTWWFSGLFAKGYALFFLILAALLWRMVSRDPIGVALLSGAAWAAHPSASLVAPAVLLYIVSHRSEIRALGLRRLCWLIPAAILLAFGPNLLLLPLLSARDSIYSLGHAATADELLRYLTGARFTSLPGVWGFVGWRGAHVLQYAWEEFLGVGAVLVSIGMVVLIRERREERWGLLAWMLPVIAGATLFKIEGQFDFWLVSAWMPLWLCAALGLSTLRRRRPRAPQAALAVGLVWAVAANGQDLYLRGERLPEVLGRSMLGTLDPGATLIVSSDDAIGLCHYLQSVRKFRTDVRVVLASMLSPTPDLEWYTERFRGHWPDFGPAHFQLILVHAAEYALLTLTQSAVVQGRKPGSRPVFFDTEPAAALLPPGSVLPAGFLWKWSERPEDKPEARYWDFPVKLEAAAAHRGRKRGIAVTYGRDTLGVNPQSYEERIIYYLVQARRKLGDLAQREGSRDGFEQSARAYESIHAAT